MRLPAGLLFAVLLPCAAAAKGAVGAAPELSSGWSALEKLDPSQALVHFAAAAADPALAREAAFGTAIATLHRPPPSGARTRQAVALLETVATGGATDELGLAARFQLARLAEFEATPGSHEVALARYRRLHADAPGHFYGQYAWLRIASLELVALTEETALLSAVRARAEASATVLTDPRLRRNFARLVAWLAHRHASGESLALAAAREGLALGYGRWDIEEEMLALVIRLAERAGEERLLRESVATYLERFPRGPRRTLVEGCLPPRPAP